MPFKNKATNSTEAKEIEITSDNQYIKWRYKNSLQWFNIVPLKELKGEPGSKGAPGLDGKAGVAGAKGEKGDRGERGLTGKAGKNGDPGIDGDQIELRKTATHIQWRYVGLLDGVWRDLVALSELTGKDGKDGKDGLNGKDGSDGLPGKDGKNGKQGPRGERGPQGYPGSSGPRGIGVPAGGTTGQVLAKTSNEDYNTQWVDQSSSGGGSVTSVNSKTGVVILTKDDIGLSNVDNTSDASKPISTATQTALDAKQDTLVSGTNIKTINGGSVLGSGDLVISTPANYDGGNASSVYGGAIIIDGGNA